MHEMEKKAKLVLHDNFGPDPTHQLISDPDPDPGR